MQHIAIATQHNDAATWLIHLYMHKRIPTTVHVQAISPTSIPVSNQPSTPASAPAWLPNDEIVSAFENVTVSSSPASPQVTNDIQKPVTGSNTDVTLEE